MATSSPHLLGLPPEIRTRIYELHFAHETTALQKPTHYIDKYGKHHWKIFTQTAAPALLLADKQIHREAIAVYYSRVTLKIRPAKTWDTGGPDRCALEVLAFWIDKIPSQWHQQISSIVVDDWRLSFQRLDEERRRESVRARGNKWRKILAANGIFIQSGIVRYQV